MKVSLLTGGQDLHYALGLLSGLALQNIDIEFIGNDAMQASDVTKYGNVKYFNLRGDQNPRAPIHIKMLRVLQYYFKLIRYAALTNSKIFHILWLNKFTYIDRTIINCYYKMLGKKILYTAHDINYRKLVGQDTILNELTLRIMYNIVDHIFVHTEKMKKELIANYGIRNERISIVPFGINDVIPNTDLTEQQAREKLNLNSMDKIALFFGNIAPYKGLEYLITAMNYLKTEMKDIRLIIAGRIKDECQDYWANIQNKIEEYELKGHIIERIEYIPEVEAEIYFKSADVLILPYKNIFQSGLIYTSYRFGLPVVATAVGSLGDDVIEGKTGFICKPEDPNDLANSIQLYFKSDLFNDLAQSRKEIIRYGMEKYSWGIAGEKTASVYDSVMNN